MTRKITSDRRLTFGIDFDGTFAADPACFVAIVEVLHRHGHTPVLVTARPPPPAPHGNGVMEKLRQWFPAGGGFAAVVFADGRTKVDAVAEAGHRVDVWVDDMPDLVGKAYRRRRRWG